MIDKLTLTDEQKTELETYIETIKKDAMELAKNDSEFIKSIKGNGIAEAYTKAQKSVLKLTGLSKEEIKEIDGDFDKILEFALSKVASGKDATNQEIQAALINAQNEISKYKDEIIPSIEKDYENRFHQRLVNENTFINIADEKQNLIVEPSVFKTLFDSTIQSLGIVLSLENDKVSIKKQDGTLFYNGTTKIDDIKQLIEYVAKTTKLWRESAGQGAGNGGQGNAGGNGGASGVTESANTKALRERLGV